MSEHSSWSASVLTEAEPSQSPLFVCLSPRHVGLSTLLCLVGMMNQQQQAHLQQQQRMLLQQRQMQQMQQQQQQRPQLEVIFSASSIVLLVESRLIQR